MRFPLTRWPRVCLYDDCQVCVCARVCEPVHVIPNYHTNVRFGTDGKNKAIKKRATSERAKLVNWI